MKMTLWQRAQRPAGPTDENVLYLIYLGDNLLNHHPFHPSDFRQKGKRHRCFMLLARHQPPAIRRQHNLCYAAAMVRHKPRSFRHYTPSSRDRVYLNFSFECCSAVQLLPKPRL
jgi:hypothetical protein